MSDRQLSQTYQTSKYKRIWIETRQEVSQLTDALGKGVDEGIKEAVVALRVYGFPTTGSCEGHLDWGLPYPWIDISEPEPANRFNDEQKAEAWRKANLIQQRRILEILIEFHRRNRQTPFDVRLSIESSGFGKFRLKSIGGNIFLLLSLEEKKKKLGSFRAEMFAFTKFLSKKWLSNH